MMIGMQCKLCGEECESAVHVLWECPVYDTIRNTFMGELDNPLGGSFEEFSALIKRTGFVLGCENWEGYDFKGLLKLVKSCIILLIWDTRKNKLYGNQNGTGEISGCSCLSSDWRSYKLQIRLHLWVRGRWRKRYGSNMSILLSNPNFFVRRL